MTVEKLKHVINFQPSDKGRTFSFNVSLSFAAPQGKHTALINYFDKEEDLQYLLLGSSFRDCGHFMGQGSNVGGNCQRYSFEIRD